ncbi:MAG: hypothetical protein RL007_267 [Bacteroidota bacterium]|jgi:DNA-binding NarL/FixJ family response regulator
MKSNEISQILIADDHHLIIDGIRSLLSDQPQLNISSEAHDGEEAWERISECPKDIHLVLADVTMPRCGGIELCRRIKQQFSGIKVLIVTMHKSVSVLNEAIDAEADGYVLKESGKAELVAAINRVLNGGTWYSNDLLPVLQEELSKGRIAQENRSALSIRETEVLSLIVKELTSEEISEQLGISKKTVDNHRQHILEKTGCRSTVGLVKFALQSGFHA